MKMADEEHSCSGEYGSSSTSGDSDAGHFVEDVMRNIGLIEPYRFKPMFSSSSSLTDESDDQHTDSSLSNNDRLGNTAW